MECLGGNGYVEEGILARHYRESPVNAIWEGSGQCDVPRRAARAVARGRRRRSPCCDELAARRRRACRAQARRPAFIAKAFRRPDSERVARLAVEKLALLAAAAALNEIAPRSAELFASTRLANPHASMYGAVDLAENDARDLLERALP